MAAAIVPEAFTVDVADYLVERGVPFREAHASVGKALRLAEEKGRELDGLTVEEWQSVDPRFDEGTLRLFDLSVALDRRDATGGTSRRALREQLASARARLAEWKAGGVG
jgi:argininosuccinate lyase